MTAAINSSRGNVSPFSGATQDFDITRVDMLFLLM